MAITNGYATLAEYKAYHTVTSTDSTDDGVIEDMIEGASRHIDNQTQRTFYGRTETHYFSVPSGRRLLMDDDLLSITTLTNGSGDTIASSEYHFLPRNKTPYYAVVLNEATTVTWLPDSNNQYEYAISLAGSWGWSATRPDDVNVYCLEIAKALYARRTGQNIATVARVTSMGVVLMPQGVPSFVAEGLAAYRKRT